MKDSGDNINKKESLYDLFHVDVLDFKTRAMAGLIIDGKIYINKTHNGATREFCNETKRPFNLMKEKHSYLHIIDDNVFIDINPLLTNLSIDEVISIVRNDEQFKDSKIWTYAYKKYIERVA